MSGAAEGERPMNTANLQIEGLLVAVARLCRVLQDRGAITRDALDYRAITAAVAREHGSAEARNGEGGARDHQPEDDEDRAEGRKAEGEPGPEQAMVTRR